MSMWVCGVFVSEWVNEKVDMAILKQVGGRVRARVSEVSTSKLAGREVGE